MEKDEKGDDVYRLVTENRPWDKERQRFIHEERVSFTEEGFLHYEKFGEWKDQS